MSVCVFLLNYKIVKMLKRFYCLLLLGVFVACDIDENRSRACFIGDSITYQWDLEFFFPHLVPLKHAENGATIQDLDDWNLDECRGIPSVILMGTNNLGVFFEDSSMNDFLKDYFSRIERIQADPLVVVSILPRNFERKQDQSTNRAILNVNREIEKGLDSLKGNYEYLNVFPLFLDDDFNVRMDLFKDGLHPNIAGQEILTSEVMKKLRL